MSDNGPYAAPLRDRSALGRGRTPRPRARCARRSRSASIIRRHYMTVGGLQDIQAPLARRSRAPSLGLPAGRRAGAPVRISPAGHGSAPRYRRSISSNDEARGSPGPLSVSRRYCRRYRVILVRDPLLILARRVRLPDVERPEARKLGGCVLATDPRAVRERRPKGKHVLLAVAII